MKLKTDEKGLLRDTNNNALLAHDNSAFSIHKSVRAKAVRDEKLHRDIETLTHKYNDLTEKIDHLIEALLPHG